MYTYMYTHTYLALFGFSLGPYVYIYISTYALCFRPKAIILGTLDTRHGEALIEGASSWPEPCVPAGLNRQTRPDFKSL